MVAFCHHNFSLSRILMAAKHTFFSALCFCRYIFFCTHTEIYSLHKCFLLFLPYILAPYRWLVFSSSEMRLLRVNWHFWNFGRILIQFHTFTHNHTYEPHVYALTHRHSHVKIYSFSLSLSLAQFITQCHMCTYWYWLFADSQPNQPKFFIKKSCYTHKKSISRMY